MAEIIKLDDAEYEVENLSDTAKATLAQLEFTTQRLSELKNMGKLLQRARKSYIGTLRNEMLAEKAGFLFGED
jgi:DNA repair ATPase RecN